MHATGRRCVGVLVVALRYLEVYNRGERECNINAPIPSHASQVIPVLSLIPIYFQINSTYSSSLNTYSVHSRLIPNIQVTNASIKCLYSDLHNAILCESDFCRSHCTSY